MECGLTNEVLIRCIWLLNLLGKYLKMLAFLSRNNLPFFKEIFMDICCVYICCVYIATTYIIDINIVFTKKCRNKCKSFQHFLILK